VVGRFDYYESLSERQKAIYRKSDSAVGVRIREAEKLAPLVEEVRASLSTEKPAAVQKATASLCDALTTQLGIAPVAIKVRARRPSGRGEELYGMYEWEEGEQPRIQLWMKTSVKKQVVSFRTFIRTLLHEFCHHLDYTLLGLEETFHTQGFFKRESSLMRALVPKEARPSKKPKRKAEPKEARKRGPEQMELPLFKEPK
jgi:hypothetical protein